MTEKPFLHKYAFKDVVSNFIFQEEIAKILFKILKYKGILNIGGKKQSIYSFAKIYNKKTMPLSRKKSSFFKLFPNVSMNLKKMKKLVN
jgi:dTDP-4-dehydrorhamnose reductase